MMILKDDIKEHIGNCMKSFVNNYQHRELIYQRLDELFLLWGKLNNINFIASLAEFGLHYEEFNNKDYSNIAHQIRQIFPSEEFDI